MVMSLEYSFVDVLINTLVARYSFLLLVNFNAGIMNKLDFKLEFKVIYNVLVYYSLGLGVDRFVESWFCGGDYSEVNMSKIKNLWRFVAVYIGLLL